MKVSIILPYYNRLPYLRSTLVSLEHFYGKRDDLEVVLVDDGSDKEHELSPLLFIFFPKLKIKIVRIKNKTGRNPCVPYNVGVRHSTGDVLVLSSPETVHTSSMFELADDFKDLGEKSYFCFSVFCPTDQDFTKRVLAIDENGEALDGLREELKGRSFPGLGLGGRDTFNNDFGSWYLHSLYRASHLNFFTAMKRKLFNELGGFDERFRFGTGHDDLEFLTRLMPEIDGVNGTKYFDDALAVHLNHPPVYGSGDPVSNSRLFDAIYPAFPGDRKEPAYQSNDLWGREEVELVWGFN